MGKVNTGKESAKKQKENNKNQAHVPSGQLKEQNSFTNKTEKWTGKDGYMWNQEGKVVATNHPKESIYRKRWKCQRCIEGTKNITVSQFDVYFSGGDNGKYIEKYKISCKCGWRGESDVTLFGPDPNKDGVNNLTSAADKTDEGGNATIETEESSNQE